MSDRQLRPDATSRTITRRSLLGATAAVGGLGMLSGVTGAVLRDGELFRVFNGAGHLDLAAAWRTSGGDDGTSGGSVSIDVGPLAPGESGFAVVDLRLPDDGTNNPGYLWFRTFCPESSTVLANALDVSLWYAEPDGDRLTGSEPLFEGTLCELTDAFREGSLLDAARDTDATPGTQACLQPDGSALSLRLEWELGEYEGTESTTLDFQFVATQCRHSDGTDDPFAGLVVADCGCLETEGDPDPDGFHGVSFVAIYAMNGDACEFLGKFELDDGYAACYPGAVGGSLGDNFVDTGTYELFRDDDCEPTGHDLVVTETVTKGAGGDLETVGFTFDVEAHSGPDPTLCQVVVKGGPVGCAVYGPADLDGNGTGGVVYAPSLAGGTTCPEIGLGGGGGGGSGGSGGSGGPPAGAGSSGGGA
jgi:hypothetical protein